MVSIIGTAKSFTEDIILAIWKIGHLATQGVQIYPRDISIRYVLDPGGKVDGRKNLYLKMSTIFYPKGDTRMSQDSLQSGSISHDILALCSLLARIMRRCLAEQDTRFLELVAAPSSEFLCSPVSEVAREQAA